MNIAQTSKNAAPMAAQDIRRDLIDRLTQMDEQTFLDFLQFLAEQKGGAA